MLDIIIITSLIFILWFWYDSLRAKHTAVDVSRRACEARKLHLLDDTAALKSLFLRRDFHGRLRICRIYQFEYANNQHDRLTSTITLCGKLVIDVGLRVKNNNIVRFPGLRNSF